MSEGYKSCPMCDGQGFYDTSACCGADITPNGGCAYCRKPAELTLCCDCQGTGLIEKTPDEIDTESFLDWLSMGEARSDADRDDEVN